MIIRYLIGAATIAAIAFSSLSTNNKVLLIVVANAVVWFCVAAFWLWVSIQAYARRILLTKMVIIIIALALVAILRSFMAVTGVFGPIASALPTLALGFVVLIETIDLWEKAGRQPDNIEQIEK